MSKQSLVLLCASAVLFVIMGMQNNVLSALTPEMSAFFGISENTLDFLYPASWIVSFVGTILFHVYFTQYVSFFRYATWTICIVYAISTALTASTFLLKEWLNDPVIVLLTLLSNLLFGFVMVTLSIWLETIMNNKFSLAKMYKNNGMWSLILLFKYGGWMASYFVLPLLFALSMYSFVAVYIASSAFAIGTVLYLNIKFAKYTTPIVMENGMARTQKKYRTLALLVVLNMLSNGTWFALLLYLPQNLQVIGFFPQEVIVIGMVGGILLATASWYFTSSPLQWLIVGILSLTCCVCSTIVVDFSSPPVIALSAVLLCVGSGGFYSAPYVAAVNLLHNDDVRLAFMWLSASSSLTIVALSELFAFIKLSDSYSYSINILSFFYFAIAIYILLRIYGLLCNIPPDSFKKSAQQVLYINRETQEPQDFKEISQNEHELNETSDAESTLVMEDDDDEITPN